MIELLISYHTTGEWSKKQHTTKKKSRQWNGMTIKLNKIKPITQHILHSVRVNAIKTKCKSVFMSFVVCRLPLDVWSNMNERSIVSATRLKVFFTFLRPKHCFFLGKKNKWIWCSVKWKSFSKWVRNLKNTICSVSIENYSVHIFTWILWRSHVRFVRAKLNTNVKPVNIMGYHYTIAMRMCLCVTHCCSYVQTQQFYASVFMTSFVTVFKRIALTRRNGTFLLFACHIHYDLIHGINIVKYSILSILLIYIYITTQCFVTRMKGEKYSQVPRIYAVKK